MMEGVSWSGDVHAVVKVWSGVNYIKYIREISLLCTRYK